MNVSADQQQQKPPMPPIAFALPCLRLSPATGHSIFSCPMPRGSHWCRRPEAHAAQSPWESDPRSPGGSSKTRSVRCSRATQRGPLSLPACLGLRGCSAPISQLVEAMRLTVFPSADQLPDWCGGTCHGVQLPAAQGVQDAPARCRQGHV